MDITCFVDLLQAARAQPQPQRLLFVFAGIELPEDSTAEQRAGFERGEGGALVPLMCVDKAPDELHSFDDLIREAAQFDKPWGMVFASAMAGPLGLPPRSEDAEEPLKRMVEAIRQGQVDAFIPFNPRGQAVRLR